MVTYSKPQQLGVARTHKATTITSWLRARLIMPECACAANQQECTETSHTVFINFFGNLVLEEILDCPLTFTASGTTAYQRYYFIQMGSNQFLVTIDAMRVTVYPISRLFSREELFKNNGSEDSELMLFEIDPSLQEEMSEKKAPHTMDASSYELEIKFQGEWMEMLGSGIMRQPI